MGIKYLFLELTQHSVFLLYSSSYRFFLSFRLEISLFTFLWVRLPKFWIPGWCRWTKFRFWCGNHISLWNFRNIFSHFKRHFFLLITRIAGDIQIWNERFDHLQRFPLLSRREQWFRMVILLRFEPSFLVDDPGSCFLSWFTCRGLCFGESVLCIYRCDILCFRLLSFLASLLPCVLHWFSCFDIGCLFSCGWFFDPDSVLNQVIPFNPKYWSFLRYLFLDLVKEITASCVGVWLNLFLLVLLKINC